MAYEIAKLNQRHYNIMRLMLLGRHDQKTIARLCGFDSNSIGYIVNSPIFQEEMARRRNELTQSEDTEIINQLEIAAGMLNNAAVGAAIKLDELANNSADENVQLRAADIILKTAFGREPPRGAQAPQVFVLDASKLAFLQAVATESGLIEGAKREHDPVSDDEPERVVATTAISEPIGATG